MIFDAMRDFFFQAEDGIRDTSVTGVQTCALPISSTVVLRLEWPHPPGMRNMHAFGQSGVDLYVRNTYWGTAVPDKDAAPGKIYEHVYFKGQPGVMRDITIYLALYSPVKVLEIALDKNAAPEAAT